MKLERLSYLFRRYLNNTCTSVEERQLMLLLSDPALEEERRDILETHYETVLADRDLTPEAAEMILKQILPQGQRPAVVAPKTSFLRMPWFRYAAVVILILAGGIYLFSDKPAGLPHDQESPKSEAVTDIPAGGDKAILTLADGSTIVLEDAANGALATQGVTQVIKLDNGQLAYRGTLDVNKMEIPKETLYNTISTPRGGRYQIVLPDGTKVWLNAASSIRFPTIFGEKERNVTITGEAYLEVEKDARRSFTISVNSLSIDVLGTDFNIKSYPEDYTSQATLIAGMIRVKNNQSQIFLRPGEFAAISNKNIEINYLLGPIVVPPGHIESLLAWKNGLFVFKNTDIKEIMAEFSRWYDVDIIYRGNVSKETFTGKISRSAPLSQALKLLEMTNTLHFKRIGKMIEVSSP